MKNYTGEKNHAHKFPVKSTLAHSFIAAFKAAYPLNQAGKPWDDATAQLVATRASSLSQGLAGFLSFVGTDKAGGADSASPAPPTGGIDNQEPVQVFDAQTGALNAIAIISPESLPTGPILQAWTTPYDWSGLVKTLLALKPPTTDPEKDPLIEVGVAPHHLTQIKDLVAQQEFHLALLLLSGWIERLAGDLFLAVNQDAKAVIPTVMRDIVASQELVTSLGQSFVAVLLALIGPPTALNARNVSWHGFLDPDHPLVPIITPLVLAAARTMAVETLRHFPSPIAPRAQVTWTNFAPKPGSHFDTIGALWSDSTAQREALVRLASHSWGIVPGREALLAKAHAALAAGQYAVVIACLAPVIEHSMRRLYVSVNSDNVTEDALTASSDAVYTTLDLFICPTLATPTILPVRRGVEGASCNLARDVMGRGVIIAVHDLCFSAAGPRLRDRVAHGSGDTSTLHRSHAAAFLAVVTALAAQGLDPGKRESLLISDVKVALDWVDSYEPLWTGPGLAFRALHRLPAALSHLAVETTKLSHLVPGGLSPLEKFVSDAQSLLPTVTLPGSYLTTTLPMGTEAADPNLVTSIHRSAELCEEMIEGVISRVQSQTAVIAEGKARTRDRKTAGTLVAVVPHLTTIIESLSRIYTALLLQSEMQDFTSIAKQVGKMEAALGRIAPAASKAIWVDVAKSVKDLLAVDIPKIIKAVSIMIG